MAFCYFIRTLMLLMESGLLMYALRWFIPHKVEPLGVSGAGTVACIVDL